jgi:hypothetical protein
MKKNCRNWGSNPGPLDLQSNALPLSYFGIINSYHAINILF